MKYYRLTTTDPYYNLAVEEYLLDEERDDCIMLWQNEPSVVVGINQNIRAEVDMSALLSSGVHPVRRITGGGAVYHDGGNINYTFIARSDGGIDFQRFSSPIIEALASLGVTLTLSGRNDLCLPDGRKVSGAAECSRGGRTLHHGTLLYSADLDALAKLLTPSPEKLETKAIKSTRSRVANLKDCLPSVGNVEELISLIERYVIGALGAEKAHVPESDKIEALTRRNKSDEWLYPERGISSSLAATKRRRYDFGTVEISLTLLGEKISDIRILGDFFGEAPIDELCRLLRGAKLSELEALITPDVLSHYVKGMNAGELISLITE